MSTMRIVVAAAHRRYDRLVDRLREEAGHDVVRIKARDELTIDSLSKLAPQFVFFPHWSWRISREVHEAFESIVFHMTDVPFGRGGSPLQNLIHRGISTTMLSALRCVEELDAGPVYLKRPLELCGSAEEILLRASDLMYEMINQIVQSKPDPVPQAGVPVFFTRRTPDQSSLTTAKGLREIYDFIRMLDADGYPSAFLETEYFRFEFTRASLRSDSVVADVRIMDKRKEK